MPNVARGDESDDMPSLAQFRKQLIVPFQCIQYYYKEKETKTV